MTLHLVNSRVGFPARARRSRLRAIAGKLLPDERVAGCGRPIHTPSIKLAGRRASFAGIATCGSVWHCAECAEKVAAQRRLEVRAIADRHCRDGGEAYMAAFTLRHDRWQSAETVRDAVTSSWKRVFQGQGWYRLRDKGHSAGWVRALEVTHGENGWHVHIHAVFFLRAGGDAEAFGAGLFKRWSRAVERAGFGLCNPDIWQFERAAHLDAVTDYVVKGNFDFELTHGHTKTSRGGRTPWQLLEAAPDDADAAQLFQQFAAAFKGARQLTWSKSLGDMRDDIEVAAAEIGETIGIIPRATYCDLIWRGLGPPVLDAAETGGFPAVVALLKHHRLWRGDDDGPVDGSARQAS